MKRISLPLFILAGLCYAEDIDAEILKDLDFYMNLEISENLEIYSEKMPDPPADSSAGQNEKGKK